jgi:hypothetical protein
VAVIHTCARDSSARICVRVSSVAGTHDGVVLVMRTGCIGITPTVVYLAGVCEHQIKQQKFNNPGGEFESRLNLCRRRSSQYQRKHIRSCRYTSRSCLVIRVSTQHCHRSHRFSLDSYLCTYKTNNGYVKLLSMLQEQSAYQYTRRWAPHQCWCNQSCTCIRQRCLVIRVSRSSSGHMHHSSRDSYL